MFIQQVIYRKQNTKQTFTNTLCLQNKTNVYNTNVYKTKKFTNTLCLQNKIQNRKFTKQNKNLQTRYAYKTKYKTERLQNKTKIHTHVMFTKQKCTDKLCLQNKTKVYIQVMFTKQNTKQKVYKTKLKFTNTCLQNKIQNRKFTKQTKSL